MTDYEQMIVDLDKGAKVLGKSPAGWREKRAADLLRFLGDPRVGICWSEAKGWHKVGDPK